MKGPIDAALKAEIGRLVEDLVLQGSYRSTHEICDRNLSRRAWGSLGRVRFVRERTSRRLSKARSSLALPAGSSVTEMVRLPRRT